MLYTVEGAGPGLATVPGERKILGEGRRWGLEYLERVARVLWKGGVSMHKREGLVYLEEGASSTREKGVNWRGLVL